MPSTNRLILAVGICVVCIGVNAFDSSVASAAPTVVALTMTKSAEAGKAQPLVENLLSLVELSVQQDKSISIVERRQIDLAFQEFVLDQSRPVSSQLQLGKLITADYLVMLETLPVDKDAQKPWARLRVVDPKTAAIRGVTVAGFDEATLEETAEQFGRYVSTVIRSPDKPTATVAVAPFESQGRFDRLRPLELGIRDLVTARLLALSGAAPGGFLPVQGGPTLLQLKFPLGALPRDQPFAEIRDREQLDQAQAQPGQAPEPPPARFQVLQRASMEQLLRELDLIQSGFADKDRLKGELPARGAAYLVRGEIDERPLGDKFDVVVRGELVEAASQRVLEKFELECPPTDLEARLATEVDRIAVRLLRAEKIPLPAHVAGCFEVQSVKELALVDVRRFVRMIASTHELRAFTTSAPGQLGAAQRQVKTGSPLGRHLLQKSIDRFESILFITPGDAQAAYALGFCYSLHQDGIYQPDRADDLLRKAYLLDRDSQPAAWAMEFLADIAYDDQTAVLEEGGEAKTIERTLFAFEHYPETFRAVHWAWLLRNLGHLYARPEQNAELANLLTKTARYADETDPKMWYRPALIGEVATLALQLVRQARDEPALKEKGMELLERWAESPDKQLANPAGQGLAIILAQQGDYLAAAAVNKALAAKLAEGAPAAGTEDQAPAAKIVNGAPAANPAREAAIAAREASLNRQRRYRALIEAARNTRLAGQPEQALQQLQGFEKELTAAEIENAEQNPQAPGTDLLGRHGFEVGACYEALEQPEKAHAAYLQAVEKCPLIITQFENLQRLIALGGIPLKKDRGADVEYFPQAENEHFDEMCLASDGKKIYVGTKEGLRALDMATKTWEPTQLKPAGITCLKAAGERIWAGTNADGLWRRDSAAGEWTQVAAGQLPDSHVQSIALDGENIYVGVGTPASGGLVEINAAGQVHVFNEAAAPASAPTHIIVGKKTVLARTPNGVYEWSLENKKWQRLSINGQYPNLFAGTGAIWASVLGRELSHWGGAAEENVKFGSTWYTPPNNRGYVLPAGKAGYQVNFVLERGTNVWFGGHPWIPFLNSGLYRFNSTTGSFYRFGPSDGFKPVWFQQIYDGLWVDDRLWLATSEGLCAMSPVKQ